MNKVSPTPVLSVDAAYNQVVEMCEIAHGNFAQLLVHLDRLLGAEARPEVDRVVTAPGGAGQPASGATANAPPHLWLLHDQLSTLNGMLHRASDQISRLERV